MQKHIMKKSYYAEEIILCRRNHIMQKKSYYEEEIILRR